MLWDLKHNQTYSVREATTIKWLPSMLMSLVRN